jgi:hypothetical protein
MTRDIKNREAIHSPSVNNKIDMRTLSSISSILPQKKNSKTNTHNVNDMPLSTSHYPVDRQTNRPTITKINTHPMTPSSQSKTWSQSTYSECDRADDDTISSQIDSLNVQAAASKFQTSITPVNENMPFGDLLTPAKQPGSLRIVLQNVNGIYKAKSWHELNKLATNINELKIDVFGAVETNIKWNFKYNNLARAAIRKHTKQCSITTSSNKEQCITSYQPGGTLTAVMNQYIGRIMSAVTDSSTLGRWSGYSFRTNFNTNLHILSVYQPTKSDGIHSTYQQHAHYFKQTGINNPNPRKLLLHDLTTVVRNYNQAGDKTIILIDANDSLFSNDSLLPKFLADCHMTSLVSNPQHHPPTHARGSKCIDYILGSTSLLEHVKCSGISPFYSSPWPNSDHRNCFVDLDAIGLFGATTNTIIPPPIRKITSKSKPIIQKFIDALGASCHINDLHARILRLSEIKIWTTNQHDELEYIDRKFTSILLDAEQACAIPSEYPWSPTLHRASQVYQYWCVTLFGKKNNINVTVQLQTILDNITEQHIFQGNPLRNTVQQLRLARKHLINCRIRAKELREEYLDILHEQLVEEGNMTKAEAVRQMINTEKQSQCWRTFKLLRSGTSSTGGVSHVLIPEPSETGQKFKKIQLKQELDSVLLQQNITHFSQAAGTPFTVSPLIDIIGEDGCTEQALRILEGHVPQNLPKYSRLLLHKLQRVREPISLQFTFNDMCEGFSKWRESTTTSPSGKHLGVYKALINAVKFDLHEKSFKTRTTSDPSITVAYKCLVIQHKLMALAITNCHTYQRWTVVHNFLLEKIPGVPRIDKLRVIHLYEADWSLIQKFFVAFKLNKLASSSKTVPIEQAGGRPGRSAIELAAARVLTFETIRLQRLSGAAVYNDAKACYDRVIENASNLALMKQGLPVELARLHAQTFKEIKYYIKHRLGIGDIPHSHHRPKPVYGVGQGSTDAPARWGFLCDPLIDLYKENASEAIIKSPLSDTQTNNKIGGFVDDTATLSIQHYSLMLFICLILQKDAQMWEKLLHTSGGKLEIPKCVFSLFKWKFDKHGRPALDYQTNNTLHIRSSSTKEITIIPQIEPSIAYKYVGVHIALNGNMSAQLHELKKNAPI